jgi:hypothetical protein
VGGRELRALTLHEPWSSLIAGGLKTIETRSWQTGHRGRLAIHSAKRRSGFNRGGLDVVRGLSLDQWQRLADHLAYYPPERHERLALVDPEKADSYPLGCVVATCVLDRCLPILDMTPRVPRRHVRWHGTKLGVWDGDRLVRDLTAQAPFGDFTPGRYAWMLSDVRPVFPPRVASGKQGLWEWPTPLILLDEIV